MSESFGTRLRRRREERGIDLIAIAEQTKIKLSLLEGLEQDDVSNWPSGIFRRAFIRAYAQAIDLDVDLTVREFLEVHPDRGEPEMPAALVHREEAGSSNGGPPTRLRSLVGSAIESLARLRRGPHLDDHGPLPFAEPDQVGIPRPGPTVEPFGEPIVQSVVESGVELGVEHANDPDVERVAGPEPPQAPRPLEPDLLAVSDLCTEFARVQTTTGVQRLLERAAGIVHASGLIVWVWDPSVAALTPALAHGYSDRVIAQLPAVARAADNAVAAAFRSEQACAVEASEQSNGALALPLITPAGCAGVLAIELPLRGERAAGVRAVATILAAMLAQLVVVAEPAAVQERAHAR